MVGDNSPSGGQGVAWYYSIVTAIKDALDAIYAKKTDLTSKADKTNGANQITDTTSTFSHLGTLSDYKQSTINQAIDTAIGNTGGVSLKDIIKHLTYIQLTSSMVSGDTVKTVTYTDGYGERNVGDVLLINNNTGYDLDVTTSYKINNSSDTLIILDRSDWNFYKNDWIIAIKAQNNAYYGYLLNSKPTPFVSNNIAYNNIKSGESTSLTLTNQKLINDGINTKFGEMSTVQVLVTYTDSSTETLTLYKQNSN